MALAMAIVAPAQATLIVQSNSFTTGGGVSGATIGALGVTVSDSRVAGGPVSYNFFDASLGTLNSVKWVLLDTSSAFDLDHRAQVTPPPPGPPIYVLVDFQLAAHGDVTGTVGVGGLRGTSGLSFNLAAGEDEGCHLTANPPVGLTGSPGCNVHTSGLNTKASDSLVATDLASFIGLGSFDEQVQSLLNWSTRVDAGLAILGGIPPAPVSLGPGPADVGGEFQLKGTLELVYDYTPTVVPPPIGAPAPATALLLATGLLAFRTVRRRK
jgi:hypothetical protein